LGDRNDTSRDGKVERHKSYGMVTDVLERIVSGRTKTHDLHTLLPWNWSAGEGTELPIAA
jgi:hypothetical protein